MARNNLCRTLSLHSDAGVWTFDHDDCSQFIADHGNFMLYGGCKNFLGNHKVGLNVEQQLSFPDLVTLVCPTQNCTDNVILYPAVWGTPPCQTDDDGTFANSYFSGYVRLGGIQHVAQLQFRSSSP